MLRIVFWILFALAASRAHAETINYSIYSIPLFGSQRELVSEGKKVYAPSDIKVAKVTAADKEGWQKSLSVAPEFEVGASIYRERQVDGFGMWIHKNGSGFSWEWFVRESPDTFRKLQGNGLLKVRFTRSESFDEVDEIEFLTDVTMRLNTRWFIPFLHKDTDELVVRKGSVLRLTP